MISNAWRRRLAYTAMSVLVVWHSLAMIVAPAPESATSQGLRVLLQPYLTLLRLDSAWNFFAPTVGHMSQFRYIIEDEAGKNFTFVQEEAEFSPLNPGYFWFRAWHDAIIDHPDDYADVAAARYCRKHAALHPVSITLLEMQEQDFTPADLLAGRQRWDLAFLAVNTIK